MTTTPDTAEATFETAWNDWHRERERYYGDPLGWFSLTGLYWLTDEYERGSDLPGRWRADSDAVYVESIDGTERLEPVEGAPGLLVEDGDRRIEVIRRTGSVALRVHDPKSPHLLATTGFRRIRRVNGGASQANSRPTKSRRSSRRGLSSRGSSTTTRPLVSSTSSWTVSRGSWSRSDVQTVPCMCCSPMPPAASQRTPPADHFRLTDRTPAERWPLTSTGLRTCRARSLTLRRARWRPPRTGWPSPSKPARKTRVESGTAGRSGPRTDQRRVHGSTGAEAHHRPRTECRGA